MRFERILSSVKANRHFWPCLYHNFCIQVFRTPRARNVLATLVILCLHESYAQHIKQDKIDYHLHQTLLQSASHEPLLFRSEARSCMRCGSHETSGLCRFHPALLRSPGPFLYSPEWHACKASGHTAQDPGCFIRQEHYRPTDILPTSSPPKPRSQPPLPSQPHT